MKKIRVLYTLSELVYGSKVRQLLDLVKEIDKDKFEIEIGTYHIDDEATNAILSLNVPIKQIWLHPPREFACGRIKNFIKSPLNIYNKYDIIHSLHYSSLFYEPLIAKMAGVKYIFTKTNLKWDNHKINWNLKSLLSDKIIAISTEVNHLLVSEKYGEKTILMPLGVDTNYFKPYSLKDKIAIRKEKNVPINSFVFGCAAQFVESKKQDILIKAFSELTKKYGNIFMVMCGPNYNDNYYYSFNESIKKYGNSDNIKLLGIVGDMRTFYNLIDCFVLPSIDEAFGLVFIEAMSCCVPVIGCKNTGAKDIITEECGKLVEKNSTNSLIEAMEYYIMNENNKVKIGYECRELVIDKFDNKIVVKNHEELYVNTINN